MNKKKLSSESFFLLTNESLCLLLQIELTSFVVLNQLATRQKVESKRKTQPKLGVFLYLNYCGQRATNILNKSAFLT